MSQGFTKGTPIDTDGTLSLNSDIVVPSQKAVRTYVASQVGTPVSSVTASAPILSSGGLTPNISIPAATTSVNGYLTSTDWTTFNGKLSGSGTINELAYFSAASTLSSLTTGTYPSLTELSYVKGVTSAIQTQLNGKQASLTNPVTGTGTNNEIAYFNTTGSTIGSLTTGTYPSLTELSYVKGVTSSIQTQLNAKVPSTRQLTINGTAYDLSADRSWTVTAGSADLPEISVSTSNAREDDYAPTGWPNSSNVVKVIRINSTNTDYMTCLGGLASPTAGRIVTIYNNSTSNLIVIENLSTSSTAANRFRMAGNIAYFLLPNRSVTFLYDGTYWTQFSASSPGGFDYFDDFLNLPSTASAAAYSSTMQTYASGTGAGVLTNAPGTQDVWGAAIIGTGTTATGFASMSTNVRRTGGNGAFGAYSPTNAIPYLTVSKVNLDTLATGAQDYYAYIGISGTSSLATFGMGYYWYYSGSAATFWVTRAQNTASVAVSNTTSITAAITNIWLGVYKPGGANIRDAVFFYSANGVVYSSVYKFVGTSGTYGGFPILGLVSTVGTTSKNLNADWTGSSFNLAR